MARTGPVLVGLIDSGLVPRQGARATAARRFALNASGAVTTGPALADRHGHGSRLAAIIGAAAPQCMFLNAQVFAERAVGSAAVIAAALDWAVDRGARCVNMSFGLAEDRPVLADACARAAAAGVIALAAAPARGGTAFPAAYGDVIAVSGDARCGPGVFSWLEASPPLVGACPRVPGEDARTGGASIAVAHATGAIAAFLADHPDATAADALAHLRATATHHGRENRSRP